MSTSHVRPHTCAEPGPYDYHCSEDPGHRYAHYDASRDASWTDRKEDWPTTHDEGCEDFDCEGRLVEHENPCPDPACDYNTGVKKR